MAPVVQRLNSVIPKVNYYLDLINHPVDCAIHRINGHGVPGVVVWPCSGGEGRIPSIGITSGILPFHLIQLK